MAEVLDYMLAQAFQLAGAAQTASVTDSSGTFTADFNAGGGTNWHRVYLARRSGATGTALLPYEILDRVQTALGAARWRVELRTSGLVRITYLSTGTGTITWGGSCQVQTILGGLGNVGPLAQNAFVEAPYLPTHCVLAIAGDPDSGWTREPGRFAASRMPDGRVYGFADTLGGRSRKVTLRFLPKDWATRAADSMAGTPMHGPSSRWTSPGTGEPAQAPPWGAVETIDTAGGVSLGWTDQLQALLDSSATTYVHCYLAPGAVAGVRTAPSVAHLDRRHDLHDLELAFYAEETR